MHQIRCPHCGESFTIDEAGYADILQQVRNEEFNAELERRLKQFEADKRQAVELAEAKRDAQAQQERAESAARLQELQAKVDAADTARDLAVEQERAKSAAQVQELNAQLAAAASARELAVQQARAQADAEVAKLEAKLAGADQSRELEVARAVGEVERQRNELTLRLERSKVERELAEKSLREQYETQIQDRDDTIERLRELRSKLSTKMVGESLEQHCQDEFNKVRAAMYPNAYFEKDNDARTGSKGDFIFRDYDRPEGQEGRTEIVSIMFEMKNETDSNSRKHRNEDFLKELDKDRREKGCEYAVLVSLLEEDSDLYNQGIVDVSYRYPKMYVVRPQSFMQIISLLANASRDALDAKRELAAMRDQNVDITNFEGKLEEFKAKFDHQYEQASRNFQKVIDEIDKSIDHLQKVRSALVGTDRSLEQANKRAQEITVRRLTYRNPTMQAKFKEAREAEEGAARVEAKVVEETEADAAVDDAAQDD
ncbi:MAG: DUF2130 domain-containing protein [Bifidobacterium sp.]|nr:DUF2130 domain-containing protein [Bifidobacterium sp.]